MDTIGQAKQFLSIDSIDHIGIFSQLRAPHEKYTASCWKSAYTSNITFRECLLSDVRTSVLYAVYSNLVLRDLMEITIQHMF